MEGDSVTLHTYVTEVQKYLMVQWTFGSTRIAEVNRLMQTRSMYDERFRDRLKLDDQTGSLTITNIRTTDSGLYQLTIVSRETSYMSFNLIVYERSSSSNCVTSSNNSTVNQTEDENITELYKPSSGVFGDDADAVKSVSVMEGDSVTLNTNVSEVQKYVLIQWTFGSTRIAEVNRLTQTNLTYDGPDEKFRDRLKLDQTGSLTITNTRTSDSGLYQLTIVSRGTSYMSFNLKVYDVTDAVKSVSVMEGDSVTLHTYVTEVQKYLMVQWTFGSTRIAEVNRLMQTRSMYDERFRDRLKLDDQTGSLTITNTKTNDSGLYQLTIVSRETSYMSFNLIVYERSSSSNCVTSSNNSTVNQTEDENITELYKPSSAHIHCCGFTEAVIRLVVSALVGVATVAVLVYDIRSTRSELIREEETRHHCQTSGVKSDQQCEMSRRFSSRYVQI
ncbi:hypothetical protein PO909_027980 [Leuciscus waleckii]